MAATARLNEVLVKNPDLRVFGRVDFRTPVWRNPKSRVEHQLEYDSQLRIVERLSHLVENELVLPDEHLLPTTAREVVEHWKRDDAIIIADREAEKAVAYAAYTDRFEIEMKIKLGMDLRVPSLSELCCVVVDQKHRREGIGTAIVHAMVGGHLVREQLKMDGVDDVTTFVTSQEQVIALFRRASDLLREDGMNIKFTALGEGEMGMLYQFLTLINPQNHGADRTQRINKAHPVWRVAEKDVLDVVNQYLSGEDSAGFPVGFSLNGSSVFVVTDIVKARNAEAALTRQFVNPNSLRGALITIGYSI